MIKKLNIFFLFLSMVSLSAETFYYSHGKKRIVTPLPAEQALRDHNITYYRTQNGMKLGVRKEVIAGCKPDASCQHLFDAYPVKSVEKLSSSLYLLRLQNDSDPFEVANRLYEEANITLAHPNFIRQRKLR